MGSNAYLRSENHPAAGSLLSLVIKLVVKEGAPSGEGVCVRIMSLWNDSGSSEIPLESLHFEADTGYYRDSSWKSDMPRYY